MIIWISTVFSISSNLQEIRCFPEIPGSVGRPGTYPNRTRASTRCIALALTQDVFQQAAFFAGIFFCGTLGNVGLLGCSYPTRLDRGVEHIRKSKWKWDPQNVARGCVVSAAFIWFPEQENQKAGKPEEFSWHLMTPDDFWRLLMTPWNCWACRKDLAKNQLRPMVLALGAGGVPIACRTVTGQHLWYDADQYSLSPELEPLTFRQSWSRHRDS